MSDCPLADFYDNYPRRLAGEVDKSEPVKKATKAVPIERGFYQEEPIDPPPQEPSNEKEKAERAKIARAKRQEQLAHCVIQYEEEFGIDSLKRLIDTDSST